jgi:predicted methyltransferase
MFRFASRHEKGGSHDCKYYCNCQENVSLHISPPAWIEWRQVRRLICRMSLPDADRLLNASKVPRGSAVLITCIGMSYLLIRRAAKQRASAIQVASAKRELQASVMQKTLLFRLTP